MSRSTLIYNRLLYHCNRQEHVLTVTLLLSSHYVTSPHTIPKHTHSSHNTAPSHRKLDSYFAMNHMFQNSFFSPSFLFVSPPAGPTCLLDHLSIRSGLNKADILTATEALNYSEIIFFCKTPVFFALILTVLVTNADKFFE